MYLDLKYTLKEPNREISHLAAFSNTKVIQCKVGVRRTISHCGMHSYSSIVANGHCEYIQDVTRAQTNELHTIGTF